jgi:hypothetical protein
MKRELACEFGIPIKLILIMRRLKAKPQRKLTPIAISVRIDCDF